MAPDLGHHSQEAQMRGRQRRAWQRRGTGPRLAVEQHQPAVQIVGQHRRQRELRQ